MSSPSPIYLEQIVELCLVVAAASGAVNLFQCLPGRERDLVWGDANHRPILLVKLVDVDRSQSLDLFPFEKQGSESGYCRAWNLAQGRSEASEQVDDQEQGCCPYEEDGRQQQHDDLREPHPSNGKSRMTSRLQFLREQDETQSKNKDVVFLIMVTMPFEFSATHPHQSLRERLSTSPARAVQLPHGTPQKQRELVHPGAQDMESGG